MHRIVRRRKMALLTATVLSGGTLLANGCLNLALSITPCGTVVPTTICTPVDQINLLFQYFQIPDFRADPSCTIPRGCGDGDVLPPLVGGPGGDAPDEPRSGGGGTGGGGGGGGGTGGGGGFGT
ncbi:MAG: hypothetical protein U1A27_14055 [Phycisphaerae bacterium]